MQYYFDIAEASGMPVILYNIPKMSGVSFGTEELVELLAHDGIVGVKQTDHGPHADGGAGKDLPGQGRVQRA